MSRQSIILPNTFATAPGPPSAEPMVDLDQNFDALLDGIYDSSNGFVNSSADVGIANEYVVNLPTLVAPSGYTNGFTVAFLVGNTNTGNSTLTVNTLGSATLLTGSGAQTPSGTLLAGYLAFAVYYGGSFYLISPPPILGLNQDYGTISNASRTLDCTGYQFINITLNATHNGNFTLNLTNLNVGATVTWAGTNSSGSFQSYLMTATIAGGTNISTIIAYQADAQTSAVNKINLVSGFNAGVSNNFSWLYQGTVTTLGGTPQLYMMGGLG